MTRDELDALYVASCNVLVDAMPVPIEKADDPMDAAYIRQLNRSMEKCLRQAIPDLLQRGKQELALRIAEQYDKHWGAKGHGKW